MASISKIILVISAGIFFMSCKNQINPSDIKIYSDQNKILKQKVFEMKEFKERILLERETSHTEMMSAIDPKKKASYHKDKAMKVNMGNLKDKIDETIEDYEQNHNALAKMVEDNTTYIESLSNSNQSKEVIKSEWKNKMMAWEQIEYTSTGLQNKIINLLNQFNDMQKQVLKRYGRLKQQKVTT